MELQSSSVLTFSLCVKITLRVNIWNNVTPTGGWETKTGESPGVRGQLVWFTHRGWGRKNKETLSQSGGRGLAPTVVFWHGTSIVVPTCLHMNTHARARKEEEHKSNKHDILFRNKRRRCVRLTWGELSSTTVRHEEDQPSETLVSSGRSGAC